MSRIYYSIVFTFCVLLFASRVSGREVSFYISPAGSDQNAGTLEAPFRTLNKGLDAINAERQKGDATKTTLYFLDGHHMLAPNTQLTQKHSGTPEVPLVLTAWKDAKPVLVGGIRITQWRREKDGLFSASVQNLPSGLAPREVYFRDWRMVWARYPNFNYSKPYSGSWAYVEGKPFGMYKDVEGEPVNTIVLKEQDARRWSKPTEGMVSIFPRYNWSNNILSIKSYDTATRTITLSHPMRFAARPADRFCIMGLREELDAPNEWYYDSAAKRLFFIPPKGVTLDELNREGVTLATSRAVLTLTKASNIVISGLTFTCSLGAGVVFSDCVNCSIVKSQVHDTGFAGGSAIDVLRGERCTVFGCDLYNTGASALSFSGGDDRYTLKESGHVFQNNYIHHTGVHTKSGGAVNIYGCGTKTAHNKIHDIPRTAIVLFGPKNIVEYNDIRHTNMESEDTGAIYSDGAAKWINNYGSVIRGNRIFDTIGYCIDHTWNGKYVFHRFSWGLYLDNTCSGVDICDNIIKGASIGTIFLSNPRNNRVHNNILIDGGNKQFHVSGWVTDIKKLSREKQPHTPQGDMLNYYPGMVAEYERAIKSPLWQKMPGMEIHPQDAFLEDGTVMTNNHIFSNIIYYPSQPESKYMVLNNLNLEHNEVDRNLIWNGGKVPLVTGVTGYSRILAKTTDSIPNVNFKSTDEHSFPKNWRWCMKSRDDAKAEVTAPGVIRIHAAFNPERKYIKYARIRSESFTLSEGKYYRFTLKSRCCETDGYAGAAIVSQDGGCWVTLGNLSITADNSKKYESWFKVPSPGDPKYDKRMKTFTLHLFLVGKTGWAEFEKIELEEVELASPWQAWLNKGADRHSIYADPLFVDPERGDYNLRPDSPAFKIGFKPIDFSKIGVYQDARRATWPIVEAEGVREHPEWLVVE